MTLVIQHEQLNMIPTDEEIAGGGTISSYTWICIIINFLQTRDPPILPALHQRPHKKVALVNGLDVSFDDNLEALKGFGDVNQESLGALLFAFFKKLGYEMEYESKVISVRHGKLLSKVEKEFHLLQNNRLCVEEPFNTNRSLSNSADDTSVRGLHLEFRRAFSLLSEETPNLTRCCEQYVYPKEESFSNLFVKPAPTRPVNLTRSHSNSSRQSRGHGAHNGTRQYGNGNQRTYHSSRRSSSGASTGNPMLPPSVIQPDQYMVLSNGDGTYSWTTLNQLQAQRALQYNQNELRQAQLARQLQQQQQAQMSGLQLSGLHQAQFQTFGQDGQRDQQATGLAQAQFAGSANGLPMFHLVHPQQLQYLNQYSYYQAGIIDSMAAMQYNAAMLQPGIDPRVGASRSGRNTGVHGGVRSRSQPAPHVGFNPRSHSSMKMGPLKHNGEDEYESGDHPSGDTDSLSSMHSGRSNQGSYHSNLQGQEPLEEEDEYVGYIYHDSSQASPEFRPRQNDSTQKDRPQSKERIPLPNFGHDRPPSPQTSCRSTFDLPSCDPICSSSDGDGERSVSQDSFDEDTRPKGPLIVNGSGTLPATPPHDSSPFVLPAYPNDSPQSDLFSSMYDTIPGSSAIEQLKHDYYATFLSGQNGAMFRNDASTGGQAKSVPFVNGYSDHPPAYLFNPTNTLPPYDGRSNIGAPHKKRSTSKSSMDQAKDMNTATLTTKATSVSTLPLGKPINLKEQKNTTPQHLTNGISMSRGHSMTVAQQSLRDVTQVLPTKSKPIQLPPSRKPQENTITTQTGGSPPTYAVNKSNQFIQVKSKKAKKKRNQGKASGGQPLVGEERKGG